MTTRGDMLRARFPDEYHKTFRGRGGMALTYVEDESAMDRLDEVLGLGAWQWKVEPVPGTDAVKGQLIVRWDAGDEPCVYQDFGYPTNENGAEPLKEAATDAFRRCARLVGVARYVYAGEVGAGAPPRPSPAPRPATARTVADDDQPPTFDELPAIADELFNGPPPTPWLCPVHNEPWKHFSGTAKSTGKPYDFWGCPKGRECKERPSSEWVREQEG